ncbi:MAG: DUF1674 domain-containing protein [Alphaproteobacteria bacterium]|nr:DUF1674 domain-containing protein [Alphaproteobacteria bacterium]
MNNQKPVTYPPEETIEKTQTPNKSSTLPKEIGGRKGPEPTRYGDWEKDGIASDF